MNTGMLRGTAFALGIAAAALGFAVERESFTIAPPTIFSDGTAAVVAPGTESSFTSTGGYTLRKIRIVGTFEVGNPADFASEGRIRLTDPASGTVLWTSALPAATYTTPQNVDATITLATPIASPSGTWQVRCYESFDDGGVGSVDKNWTSLSVKFLDDEPVAPTAIDLGTIGSPGLTRTDAYAAAETKWFKFTTTGPTNTTDFLNIHTRDTTNFLGGTFGANDTEIGLYSSTGAFIASNDDEDFVNDILTSLLSFGAGGAAGDLPAGTYYLAVGGFNMNFLTNWEVQNFSTASGDIVLKLETNIGGGGGGGRTVSGTVNLEDLSVSPNGWQVQWEVLDGFDLSVVESGNATLDASGNFTANLNTNAGSGYIFTVKGVHWLKGGAENVNLDSNVTGLSFSLKNGDVDGDNEVGPGDFSELSSAFGSVDGDSNWNADADLDGDGEVGPSDFSILTTNFGEAGY